MSKSYDCLSTPRERLVVFKGIIKFGNKCVIENYKTEAPHYIPYMQQAWKLKPYFIDKMGKEHQTMESVREANQICDEILYPKVSKDASKQK